MMASSSRGLDGPFRLGSLPFACAAVTALNGLYMVLVAMGNITDFDANFAFVQHVMAMDTTNFGATPGTALDADIMWRAVTAPAAHRVAYLTIIFWESLTAIVLVRAAALWIGGWRARRYAAARRWSSTGLLMIIMLFMGGFIAIGGEWFQMWRSTEWNGIDAAFRNVVMAALGLVLLYLPSADWTNVEDQFGHDEGS